MQPKITGVSRGLNARVWDTTLLGLLHPERRTRPEHDVYVHIRGAEIVFKPLGGASVGRIMGQAGNKVRFEPEVPVNVKIILSNISLELLRITLWV